MADLIDRQAAIEAMLELQKEDDDTYGCHIPEAFHGERAAEVLKSLPSAHPVAKDIDVPINDCISRQMLLEYIHGEPVGKLLCDKYNLDGLIEQFPSVQPNLQPTCNRLH